MRYYFLALHHRRNLVMQKWNNLFNVINRPVTGNWDLHKDDTYLAFVHLTHAIFLLYKWISNLTFFMIILSHFATPNHLLQGSNRCWKVVFGFHFIFQYKFSWKIKEKQKPKGTMSLLIRIMVSISYSLHSVTV